MNYPHWSTFEFEAPPILYQTVKAGSPLVIILCLTILLYRSTINKWSRYICPLPYSARTSSHEDINRFWVFTITLHCLVCDLKLHHVEDYIALQDVVRQCMYLTYTASPSFINVVHHLTMSSYTRNCSSRMCITIVLHPRPFVGTCCTIHDVPPEDPDYIFKVTTNTTSTTLASAAD